MYNCMLSSNLKIRISLLSKFRIEHHKNKLDLPLTSCLVVGLENVVADRLVCHVIVVCYYHCRLHHCRAD